MCARMGAPRASLVMNYLVLAPLHILPFKHSLNSTPGGRVRWCGYPDEGRAAQPPPSPPRVGGGRSPPSHVAGEALHMGMCGYPDGEKGSAAPSEGVGEAGVAG